MKKVIWKFPLEAKIYCEISIPKDAEILTVQDQFNEAMMWALVNPENEKEKRKFTIIGTGHEIPDLVFGIIKKYIGTYQTYSGNYVYHVFELSS